MARPLIPIGISAAILGGILLFSPRVFAGTTPTNGTTNGNRRRTQFPPNTPIGVVALTPEDCAALARQTPPLACGVRMRSEPNRTSRIVHQGVPQGSTIAILSGEQVDNEGRRWRQAETLDYVKGWVPVVGPPVGGAGPGVSNISKPANSPAWPGGDSMAGLPDAMLGWAPWGSAYAIVGQGPPLAPGEMAVCTRNECEVYGPMDRGQGWTIRHRLPAGTSVRLVPLPPQLTPRGPGSDYVIVAGFLPGAPGAWGWVRRSHLQGVQTARTLRLRRRPRPVPAPPIGPPVVRPPFGPLGPLTRTEVRLPPLPPVLR